MHYLGLLSAVSGFIGSVILFLFGIPPRVSEGGSIYLVCEQQDIKEAKRYVIYKRLGYLGISLISLSFLLSIISTSVELKAQGLIFYKNESNNLVAKEAEHISNTFTTCKNSCFNEFCYKIDIPNVGDALTCGAEGSYEHSVFLDCKNNCIKKYK